MKNFHPWRNSMIFALFIWATAFTYTYFYRKTTDLATFSESFAFTGGLLFGCSFVVSALSYFFNAFDSLLKYRREVGVIGFFFALAHSVSLVFRFPDTYIKGFPNSLDRPESILGLTAMGIFGMMALISINSMARLVGRYFRPLLRLGYLAYGLLIIRAWIIQHETWIRWWDTKAGLMPPRLVLSIFAATVILIRIIMEISLRTRRRYGQS